MLDFEHVFNFKVYICHIYIHLYIYIYTYKHYIHIFSEETKTYMQTILTSNNANY